jgi:glycerol-3-phosphate dehydrogenase
MPNQDAMKSRNEAIQAIAGQTFDVCVIGGGATGAGCALDSQLRGLKTVLVEGADFASATSSASTKLVHGGVRYLRDAVNKLDAGQYRVVKRALHERLVMIQNAPYLAHTLELIIPCSGWRELLYYGIGLKLYDKISGKSSLLPSRFLSRAETLRRMPMLADRGRKLVGSVAYADGQFDDSRYNLALIRTFTEAGGEALNYARVMDFGRDEIGKLKTAQIKDVLTGRLFEIRARVFINATGPFSDNLRQMANPQASPRLRLSKGIHILLPLDGFEGHDAIMVPKTEDGRVLFAIPWLGRLLVGTTESEATLARDMRVEKSEAEYVLRQLNPYLREPIAMEQIASAFGGLRPLVSSADARDTKKLIREHEVEADPQSGLISILGGKWTTYRAMAEETVDEVQRQLGKAVGQCQTSNHSLIGASGYSEDYWQTLVAEHGVSESTARHLVAKHGARATDVVALIREQPELAQPFIAGLAPIRAEVIFAIREEMAMSIEDILARRIGLQLHGWREAIQAAPVVAQYLAQELGWSAMQTKEAVEQYTSRLNQMLECLGLQPEQLGDSTTI